MGAVQPVSSHSACLNGYSNADLFPDYSSAVFLIFISIAAAHIFLVLHLKAPSSSLDLSFPLLPEGFYDSISLLLHSQ